MHGDDDRTGAEEQQRLEESMRDQMEHPGRIGRGAQRHGHVTQLGKRRIGHHALDIGLHDCHERHEQCRDRANNHDERKCHFGKLE